VTTVSEHLDELLLGLDDKRTESAVMDILGGGDSDETPLPCYMSKELKDRVVAALIARDPGSALASTLQNCPAIPQDADKR
jgi:hypothetical protein